MDRRKIEFYVGLFIIIGLLCAGYLVSELGEVSITNKNRYPVIAYFSSVSGLNTGARVEMAGVEIGSVTYISLDKERLLAKVELSIDKNIEFSEDIIASVKTSGIIGEKYIDIAPGGSDIAIEPGEEIYNTESSLDLESLVRKFIFSNQEK